MLPVDAVAEQGTKPVELPAAAAGGVVWPVVGSLSPPVDGPVLSVEAGDPPPMMGMVGMVGFEARLVEVRVRLLVDEVEEVTTAAGTDDVVGGGVSSPALGSESEPESGSVGSVVVGGAVVVPSSLPQVAAFTPMPFLILS